MVNRIVLALALVLVGCTGDYIDTFWSQDERVNACLPSIKAYWADRGETIYLDDSGAEIVVMVDAPCKTKSASACIIKDENRIEMDSWLFEESDRVCDVIAHEIGHGLGYQHSKSGLMRPRFPFDEEPVILPVYLDHPGDESQ